jgi:hypothetical protein
LSATCALRATRQREDRELGTKAPRRLFRNAWQRSVAEASPVAQRYQIALLQQAGQVLTSCLHVESLAASESARFQITRQDVAGRPNPPPP